MRTSLVCLFLIPFIVNNSFCQIGFFDRLSDAAIELTHDHVVYDPGYYSISYPGGDVPSDRGVCTDVIIRAYRKLGIDLQKEVHEDMAANFAKYPSYWGLNHTDRNIDHRRVPNLMRFFNRHGISLPVTSSPVDYSPGDIVFWDLGQGISHVGIVVNRRSADGERCLVVHNIGRGQVVEDCLFEYDIIGHYKYEK
jgi:uncharacterized protein YijF (DUF1287 family)